jgi:hypothetical protein
VLTCALDDAEVEREITKATDHIARAECVSSPSTRYTTAFDARQTREFLCDRES